MKWVRRGISIKRNMKNNIRVCSSNYALYGDISRRVMSVLQEFSPRFEIYSIDEAFLGLEGFNDQLVTHVLIYATLY